MSHHKRGQVAAEFMLYMTVFMFMAIVAFVAINAMQGSEIPYQQNTVAKETGESFVTIMTLAVKGGEGFSYNYTFPRSLFGRPYRLYLSNLSDGFMVMEWVGEYGEFGYSYSVPSYGYELDGCLSPGILDSGSCSNMLMLSNDGENLTITQVSG